MIVSGVDASGGARLGSPSVGERAGPAMAAAAGVVLGSDHTASVFFFPAATLVGDALELVLDLLVELLEPLEVLLVRVPVAAAVGLEERRDHVAERVGVRLQEALLHGLVLDEGVVGVLVDEVVDLARGRGPAHGVAQALRDLTPTLPATVTAITAITSRAVLRIRSWALRSHAHGPLIC